MGWHLSTHYTAATGEATFATTPISTKEVGTFVTDWTERLHDLDYDSAVALRYHGRRKAFLDGLSRLDPTLSVILGGTAFATVVAGYSKVAAGAALAVAGVSAINLAFGLTDRARLHEALFRRWGELRAKLVMLSEEDDAALRSLEVERAQIDAESPWQLRALSVLCENEEKEVRRTGPIYRVGWIQRSLANWFTLPGWQPNKDVKDLTQKP